MELFTNTNQRGDFLGHELLANAANTDMYIAVAFFSNINFINRATEKGCNIKLIVRLAEGTSIPKMGEIIDNENVSIRYFTETNFHPKLYIFKNQIAYVGSSNLTNSGLTSNQEINVRIESDNPIFDSLNEIFMEYWESAKVLTRDIIERITDIKRPPRSEEEKEYWNHVRIITGIQNFGNIERIGETNDSRRDEFIADFLRDYQDFLKKYTILKDVYSATGLRKCRKIPLEIEIDQFLNWLREGHARGSNYLEAPIREGKDLREFIERTINEFIHSEYNISDSYVSSYLNMFAVLGSSERISQASCSDILNQLMNINAFCSFARYRGGHDALRDDFCESNPEVKIKETISYLLHGPDAYQERIANCIYNRSYKLNMFGESCVTELYGLVNSEGIPVLNKRVKDSMQWLGFGHIQ